MILDHIREENFGGQGSADSDEDRFHLFWDSWDKIDGRLVPGSRVEAYMDDGRVHRGYVHLNDDGLLDPDSETRMFYNGIIHLMGIEAGDGTTIEVRESLSKWVLETPGLERLEVVDSGFEGDTIAWTPVCRVCEFSGVGCFERTDGRGWRCLNCDAEFDDPMRCT